MSSNRRQLHKYPNKWFVESGTYYGDGVQDALSCSFQNIISFEVEPKLYEYSLQRFKYYSNVTLVKGSTASLLYEYIKDINENITFFLDGHYSQGVTGYDPNYICPLLKELDQIKEHKIKTHTIIIDDRRLLRKSSDNGMDGLFDITEEEVVMKLKDINPEYKIIYENGHIENDIIVATVSVL